MGQKKIKIDYKDLTIKPMQSDEGVMEILSIRDYFAMSAMNGVLSNYADSIQKDRLEALGVMAYQIADAMLKAREQKDE